MRIQVKVNFKEKDVANVFLDEATLPVQTNVSNSDAIVEGVSNGYNGFQLSVGNANPVSRLDGSTRFYPVTGYPGLITMELSGEGGSCSTIIPFVLTGNTPENLYLNFDSVTKEHAVDFKITNNVTNYAITVTNNTSVLLVLPLKDLRLPSTLSNAIFTLKITKWSKPNSSIKITRLSTYYLAVYTGTDLKSVANSENLLDSQMQVTSGICEQYADVSVYDRYGVLRKFALTNKLTPDHVLSISAVDDADGITYEMGSYIISDWNFDGISSTVGITCRDKSYLFEKINIERSVIADRTLDELINILFAQAPGMSWRYQDSETRTRCKAIVIPNNWYHASDLYTMLNKICALGMLRIYWYVDTFIVGRCC